MISDEGGKNPQNRKKNEDSNAQNAGNRRNNTGFFVGCSFYTVSQDDEAGMELLSKQNPIDKPKPDSEVGLLGQNTPKVADETQQSADIVYSCPECDFDNVDEDFLEMHIRITHPELYQCQCNECLHRFFSEVQLAQHMQEMHG